MIGDVHGCCDELEQLLDELGYRFTQAEAPERPVGTYFRVYRHPQGRKVVFVGDLVDRGPRIADALQLARNMVRAKTGLCVLGNHDDKLLRKLRGRNVQVKHGLEKTLVELDGLPLEIQEPFRRDVVDFLGSLPSHFVLDHGRLVVAHAGIRSSMIGRESAQVREFSLYGETTGEMDEFGLPVRSNWASRYRGQAIVVYGHTAVLKPEWVNRTIDIDTGCVFGGRLTALRYPEKELVSVPAARVYWTRARPLEGAEPSRSAEEGEEPA
jgi:protein phosphatase